MCRCIIPLSFKLFSFKFLSHKFHLCSFILIRTHWGQSQNQQLKKRVSKKSSPRYWILKNWKHISKKIPEIFKCSDMTKIYIPQEFNLIWKTFPNTSFLPLCGHPWPNLPEREDVLSYHHKKMLTPHTARRERWILWRVLNIRDINQKEVRDTARVREDRQSSLDLFFT